MNIKETWNQLSNQKKNIYYWAAIILLIDVALIVQHSIGFAQTGQCRSYMTIGSVLHSCSAAEFIKNGWAWLSFTNVLIFLPAILVMVFATQIVDVIFAKPKD